jgi:hypothetical protein
MDRIIAAHVRNVSLIQGTGHSNLPNQLTLLNAELFFKRAAQTLRNCSVVAGTLADLATVTGTLMISEISEDRHQAQMEWAEIQCCHFPPIPNATTTFFQTQKSKDIPRCGMHTDTTARLRDSGAIQSLESAVLVAQTCKDQRLVEWIFRWGQKL